MKTLTEIRLGKQNEKLAEKLASLQEQYGDDAVFLATLDRAVDLVKEAGVTTDPCDQIDLAVSLAVDHLNGETKEASADESGLDLEACAHAAAEIAFNAGVTCEDVEKLGEADGELFGRMLAAQLAIEIENRG
jgi:hypothetical protein